jgi:hypothetical protein
MQTPWGKSDSITKIQRGVSWVGTPSHGGLAITMIRAMEVLSPKAINIALANVHGTALVNKPKGSYVFFEEDCAYAIAFYEHPEWKRTLEQNELDEIRLSNLSTVAPYDGVAEKLRKSIARTDERIKSDMAEVIRRWYPEYFGGKGGN